MQYWRSMARRLTYEDRQLIAAGLAAGLAYTEIARRLDRPTSTISREVARNGGPRGYQVDGAQAATRQRARRQRSESVPPTPNGIDAYGRNPATVREFQDRFTALMMRTGLPRMTARVLACLYTTDAGQLTAAELVDRLRVSPASVSAAIAALEQQELVRRERDPRGRRDRYVVDDDVWFRAWIASARMNTVLAEAAREGARILGRRTPAGARMHDTGQFFQHIGLDMIRAAEHWRHVFSHGRP
jgi:DNA-binding transcriptional regulator GbsR (MarR family)